MSTSTTLGRDDSEPTSSRRFGYLRGRDQVAFDHPAKGIVEVWSRSTNGEIAFERRFPHHRRSIAYTNGELKSLGRQARWETVSHIVPARIRAALRPSGTTTYRCLDAERYRGELDGKHYELVWLPGLDLPARFTAEGDGRRHHLEIAALVDAPAVEAALARGRDYAAMDFSDIGDNESDPFVAKLIAQGFVEQRSSIDHARGSARD